MRAAGEKGCIAITGQAPQPEGDCRHRARWQPWVETGEAGRQGRLADHARNARHAKACVCPVWPGILAGWSPSQGSIFFVDRYLIGIERKCSLVLLAGICLGRQLGWQLPPADDDDVVDLLPRTQSVLTIVGGRIAYEASAPAATK